MAKHLIDTDLYIDLIQSGRTLPIIRELYDKEARLAFTSARSSLKNCWQVFALLPENETSRHYSRHSNESAEL